MEELKEKIKKFNEERDWSQFHSPENLAKSIVIEAGELLECFQWNPNYNKQDVIDEIADVLIYTVMLAEKIEIDIIEEACRKIEKNKLKYPIDKSKGNSKKYTEFDE